MHGNVCSKPGSETAEHNPWETGSEELRDRKSGILEGQETSSSVFSGVVSKVDSFDSGLETKDSTTSLKPGQPDMSSPAEKVSLTDKQDCPDLDSKGSGKRPQRCREVWEQWAAYVAGRVRQLLAVENPLREGKLWRVVVRHIEHVKSYAPHVDHVVVDVDCRPMPKQPAGKKMTEYMHTGILQISYNRHRHLYTCVSITRSVMMMLKIYVAIYMYIMR